MRKLSIFALAALVSGALLTITAPGRALAQNVACYMAQGGASINMGSGCTLTAASGSTITVASGATLNNAGTNQIGGTTVTATATELNTLAGVTPGTVTAGKAVVTTTNKVIDALTVTALSAGTGPTNISNAAVGAAAGYKLARGAITLDGTNPSSAATGLTTIVACTVSGPAAAAIPGDDPLSATPYINGTSLDLYAWKTDGMDPTPIASTDNAAVFYWICLGT